MSDSVASDLSHMFDDNESTCVSTTSLVQSRNRYFAQLNISKYQATMERSVGLTVKFSAEINCKWRKVVDAFPTLQIIFANASTQGRIHDFPEQRETPNRKG